jgi:ribosomal protein L29
MDLKELRSMSPERLREHAAKALSQIRELRFSVGTRQQSRVRLLREAKKEFARINTVLRQRSAETKTAS